MTILSLTGQVLFVRGEQNYEISNGLSHFIEIDQAIFFKKNLDIGAFSRKYIKLLQNKKREKKKNHHCHS